SATASTATEATRAVSSDARLARGLTARLGLHDLPDLLGSFLGVTRLVDDHVVVIAGGRHLHLRVAAADGERLLRLRASMGEALVQVLDGWRHDEDQKGVGHQVTD